jgi:hypothetical protein
MGFGPLEIAAEAGFGGDRRNAADLRRADVEKGKLDMLMRAVFAAQTFGQAALSKRTRRPRGFDPPARTTG